jgi:hypothetical protein
MNYGFTLILNLGYVRSRTFGRPVFDTNEPVVSLETALPAAPGEFAELEAILLEPPAMLDVTVVPKLDPETGEVPKAFVQGRVGLHPHAPSIACAIMKTGRKTCPPLQLDLSPFSVLIL